STLVGRSPEDQRLGKGQPSLGICDRLRTLRQRRSALAEDADADAARRALYRRHESAARVREMRQPFLSDTSRILVSTRLEIQQRGGATASPAAARVCE